MIAGGFLAGYYLRFGLALLPYEEYHTLGSYVGTMVLHLLITPVALGANGLYKPRARSRGWTSSTDRHRGLGRARGRDRGRRVPLARRPVLPADGRLGLAAHDPPGARGPLDRQGFWAALRLAGIDESRVIIVAPARRLVRSSSG